MDLDQIKKSIVTNVYHIPGGKKVALHKHDKHDEIFYCIKIRSRPIRNFFSYPKGTVVNLNCYLKIRKLL